MTNSIKHTVYKTLTTALLAAAWIGCGPGQNNGTTSQAPQCKDVTVEGQDYCVIKQDIIIETGYTCPSRFAYTYEVSELVVCSNQSMIPTMPIIFEIWRLAYDMAPPDADMGGDMPTGDMARSCDDIETDYANVFDNVPTSCQQDTDCEGVPWHCGLASKTSGDICTASMSAGTDVSMLETLRDEYQQSGCSIPQCAACPAATYTCEQGTCVGRIAGERTCDDVKADYATTYAAFSTSCQVAADCEYAGVNTCGIARQVVGGCGLARATGQDTSQLMTLGQEYDSLGCGMNDPVCAACPGAAVDCVDNVCVAMEM